ncbi:uncharacterized protein LOC110030870 [Phalaenopsis equestris]|uniref:uncharacterized protein LOC110030870 n=1 Tax=Phalaenopsis equestris TaxID=78828 RepID=UPI0009E5FA97|nr:uncharacterized protein LOC110030870 [Phalaenopsis equestris]
MDSGVTTTPPAVDGGSTADAAGAIPSIANNHPSYDDMILRSIEALKDSKGSSWHAISKYITDNYSDVPPNHDALLTDHLRELHSKGVVRMSKLCYKVEDGSRKRGRPPKLTLHGEPKKRGRPLKLLSDVAATNKRKRGRPPKGTAPVANGPVYIVSRAEKLSSGLLRSFHGAVAIVLPKSILSEKPARNPILILPKGIESFTEVSTGKKKVGRPKKADIKRKRGRPRKNAVLVKQELGIYDDANAKSANLRARSPGRPWKIRDLLVPSTTQGILKKSGETGMHGSAQETRETADFVLKKRSPGRPRKNPLFEGHDPPPDVLVE